MSQFVLIAGIGHCGTKWLAQLLDRQDQGVLFYHQYKYTMAAMSWDSWLEMEHERPLAMAEYLEAYCGHMQGQMGKYRVVGDAISWMPLGIPDIDRAIPIGRVVYVIRNGIPQLNSIWHRSQFGWRPSDSWMFANYMKRYWDLMGRPHEKKWNNWTQWEKTCLWWATNAFMPGWLKRQLPETQIDVYRLEDLVEDIRVLTGLVQSFGLEILQDELITYQGKDINRKIHDSRDPAVVWATWHKEWRGAFGVICGEGMAQLGYEIPSQ